jgi:hypothetical protein
MKEDFLGKFGHGLPLGKSGQSDFWIGFCFSF